MARPPVTDTDRGTSHDVGEASPKQWEIRAALRAFQRSREATTRRNPAQQMVTAGWELVDEQEDFTVKQVTDRAGVALQTFYRHFGSKDELHLAMLEEGVAVGTGVMIAEASELEDPVDRLRFLIMTPFRSEVTPSSSRRIQWRTRERARLSQRFPDAVDAVHEPYRMAITETLEAANSSGRIVSSNPRLDALLITNLVRETANLQYRGGMLREKGEITAEAAWRLCWKGLADRSAD